MELSKLAFLRDECNRLADRCDDVRHAVFVAENPPPIRDRLERELSPDELKDYLCELEQQQTCVTLTGWSRLLDCELVSPMEVISGSTKKSLREIASSTFQTHVEPSFLAYQAFFIFPYSPSERQEDPEGTPIIELIADLANEAVIAVGLNSRPKPALEFRGDNVGQWVEYLYTALRVPSRLIVDEQITWNARLLPYTFFEASSRVLDGLLNPAKGAAIAEFFGKGHYRVGNKNLVLDGARACVLEALVELKSTTKDLLASRSGVADAPGTLRAIRAKFPDLAPFIHLPGGKSRGGYTTTIQNRSK